MSDNWGYIGAYVIIGLFALWGAFKNFRPHRLEGGYNLGGKIRYKVDRLLGIKDAPEIVATKYLGEVVKDKRGGLKGAALGGLLFGGWGVPIGAAVPMGTKTLCRFAVQYDNGEVKILDCYKGSELYKEYMRYVSWGDL